jgi:hypothetical protein
MGKSRDPSTDIARVMCIFEAFSVEDRGRDDENVRDPSGTGGDSG